jgi:hypothetical protein
MMSPTGKGATSKERWKTFSIDPSAGRLLTSDQVRDGRKWWKSEALRERDKRPTGLEIR